MNDSTSQAQAASFDANALNHSFTFGPVRIDCDMDPLGGQMEIAVYFFGMQIMSRQLTVTDDSVSCEGSMGPMKVQVTLTADFKAPSLSYDIKLCMLDNCHDVTGTLGGWQPTLAMA